MSRNIIYIRVRDTQTGHQFDALSTDPRLKTGIFMPVNKPIYPPSTIPRRPKPKKSMKDL
ncbi:hypothetical protein [Bifidobacterium scaligerum]|uniref:Uncharacterized protein n=1 Tax=Bifidobacterium scaligerum TaxID=2052656 RepID=A0A2M9HT68_9BIFI|nr:hypothetical protein [Bifidobacterium scaligerum]PJM80010.1 hypothetical protein CUU80_02425 [Bifidobacterium scaligerum]